MWSVRDVGSRDSAHSVAALTVKNMSKMMVMKYRTNLALRIDPIAYAIPAVGDHRYSRKPSSEPKIESRMKPHVPPNVMPIRTVDVDGSIHPNLSREPLTERENVSALRSDATVPRACGR